MYGIFHIRSVSVGLDSQIWYLFIYITGYLNVQKISETMDFRTFVGPLISVLIVFFSKIPGSISIYRLCFLFCCEHIKEGTDTYTAYQVTLQA